VNDLIPANATPAQTERANAMAAQIETWLEKVPTSGGDGILGILEQIAAAENPDQLDRAWNSAGFGQWIGYALEISNPRKLESDYKGGISFYLIVDAIVKATGEFVTLTTGSYAIMAQILVAHNRNWLPLTFVPEQADEPTENGFYPQHLRTWKDHMPIAPDPGKQLRVAAQRTKSVGELNAELKAKRLAAVKPAAEPAGFNVPENPEF
jgi:hypothetical protein